MQNISVTLVVKAPNDVPLTGIVDVISDALSSVGCDIRRIDLYDGSTSLRKGTQ